MIKCQAQTSACAPLSSTVRPVKVFRHIATGIVLLASLYVLLFAVFGYGFGQLFFGMFSWVSTICALSAIGSVFGVALCAGKPWCRGTLALLSVVAILCFGLEVLDYYGGLHSAGNSFAWAMQGPFVVSLLIILAANVVGWRSRPNTSLERTRER